MPGTNLFSSNPIWHLKPPTFFWFELVWRGSTEAPSFKHRGSPWRLPSGRRNFSQMGGNFFFPIINHHGETTGHLHHYPFLGASWDRLHCGRGNPSSWGTLGTEFGFHYGRGPCHEFFHCKWFHCGYHRWGPCNARGRLWSWWTSSRSSQLLQAYERPPLLDLRDAQGFGRATTLPVGSQCDMLLLILGDLQILVNSSYRYEYFQRFTRRGKVTLLSNPP